MPTEIERKFLVKHSGWKSSCARSTRIRDGLIASSNGRKVRVRIADDRATIAVKGPERGFTRAEYEYDIPIADAEEMLRMTGRLLEKVRNVVPYAGSLWQVDVYDGVLSGIVIAEIELRHEEQKFELPDWIGEEITDNPKFKKAVMVAERMATTSKQKST